MSFWDRPIWLGLAGWFYFGMFLPERDQIDAFFGVVDALLFASALIVASSVLLDLDFEFERRGRKAP